MALCQYKDVLGRPKEGFHRPRFMGFAAYDLFGTLAIAAIIAIFFYRKTLLISFIVISIILLLLGIFLHKLFCVETTLNKMIFG